jgi:hypothetical protein
VLLDLAVPQQVVVDLLTGLEVHERPALGGEHVRVRAIPGVGIAALAQHCRA